MKRLITRAEHLVVAEWLAVMVPVDARHPAGAEVDDAWVGTVVRLQRDLLARRGEALAKLQNIANGRAAEPIDALVVVADDTEIGSVCPNQLQQDALLDRVRILI